MTTIYYCKNERELVSFNNLFEFQLPKHEHVVLVCGNMHKVVKS